MFLKAKGKKKYIKSASILALAGVITVGTVLATTQQAMAKPTLPGVEKIILDNSTENPFVILEIVPDMKDASLGYFVSGEEPVDDSGKSIKDMPSKEERLKRFGTATAWDKIDELLIQDAVTVEQGADTDADGLANGIVYAEPDASSDATKSVDIRGTFYEDENGDYVKSNLDSMYIPITISADGSGTTLDTINRDNIILYRKYMSFAADEGEEESGDTEPDDTNTEGDNTGSEETDTSDKYMITLSVLKNTEDMPSEIADNVYNSQFFVAEVIDNDIFQGVNPDDTGDSADTGTDNGADDTVIVDPDIIPEEELDNLPKAGDLIFKIVEEDESHVPTKLTYVGVMGSDIDATVLSLHLTEEENEDGSEEGLEGLPDGEGLEDEIVDGEEVDGETPGDSSDGTDIIPETPGQGTEGTTGIPEQGLEGKEPGTGTSGTGDVNSGQGTDGTSSTPSQDTNDENSKDKSQEEANGTSKDNSGDNTENISDSAQLNNAAIALRRAGFFVPTQIDMMYRMSVTLEDLGAGAATGARYVVVKEADGGDTNAEYYYYISEIGPSENGEGMIATTSYGEIIRPSNGYGSNSDTYKEEYYRDRTFYTYNNANLPYTYSASNADDTRYSFTADYTQQVYDTVNYNGGFTNQEWFKKYVFDLEDSQLAAMSIDVVPVTMDELTQERLDKADLIYFANASGGEFALTQNATTDNGETIGEDGEGEISGDSATDTGAGQKSYDDICKAILKKASENIPVIMDYGLYANEGNNATLRNMAACLLHNDILEPFGEAGLSNEGDVFSSLELNDLAETMKQPMEGSTSLSYVNGNIFIYDSKSYDADDDANGSSGNDTNDTANDGTNVGAGVNVKRKAVVSGDFDKEIFTQEEINYGFQELLDEIENENFYLEVAGKENRIESRVTMATAIRHIINFGDRRNVTKTTLRVLDLEPYDFEGYYDGTHTSVKEDIRYKKYHAKDKNSMSVSKIETDSICITPDGTLNKKQWIIENLASQFENNLDDLDVTIMGTREFIGKIEDINENYDLIYLGMDTSIMNTEIKVQNGKYIKTDNTVYNLASLKGLVYTHVGDEYNLDKIVSGTDNRYINGIYRMSGNDITFDKLRELTEFIEAGYAVIVSDEMIDTKSVPYKVNDTKIDTESNMYKLLEKVVLATKEDGTYRYFGKNVNVKSAFESGNDSAVANRETFSRYLGISKLILEYSQEDLPLIYDESDGKPDYLPVDSNGVCYLNFRIKLRNDAAVDLTNTNYNCKLYVDIDADGRYAEDEVLTGLSITDGSGSEKLPDEKGKYHLKTGNTYRISRAVPEGYTGFISWKLVFEQNGQEYENVSSRALVRTAVEGYSAVQRTGEKPLIKILQITSGSGYTNLDLKDDAYMKSLYNDPKLDFKIEVTKIPAGKYIDKSALPGKTHAEYLKEFDMLVLGFYDSYKIGNPMSGGHNTSLAQSAFLGIREYALSGRSILFTHDLSGFNFNDDSEKIWSWYANRYLRDIQGMDRFGVMSSYNTIPSDEKYQYQSKYDTTSINDEVRKRDDTKEKSVPMALNNVLLANSEYKYTGSYYQYGETSRAASWTFKWGSEYTSNGNLQSLGDVAVSQVNKGQITEYPFHISETFNVSGTHGQYMQLNMDTDSRDTFTNDDIVVWYTLDKRSDLKDSIYSAVEKDVRNNYFIFNKGNITYTGSGHQKVTKEEEKRLFLNTLVAAYRAGMHAPRVLYKENEWNNSATITGKYLPYDPQMVRNTGEVDAEGNLITGGFLEETLPVHFYTTNDNLQMTNESLYAEYYIDGTKTDSDIYLDGKYYKKVTPVKVERLVEEGGQVTRANEDALRPANNSMHTATFDYANIGLGNTESIKDKYSTNIYIRLGYEPLVVPKKGSKEISLPASESFSKLNIVCTQLFELR